MSTITRDGGVTLIERFEDDPFRNLVVTRATETPDPDATWAVLNNRQTKPLGVAFTLVVAASILIDLLEGPVDEQTGTVDNYSEIQA
jgi:hypothetical protein